MKATLTFILLYLIVFSWKPAQAQGDTNNVNTIQPTIMVIPYVKEGEDLRTVLEADFKKREVIAKIKNGFDNRGFTTKDFVATLKAAKDDKIFAGSTQTDVKADLIAYSGADIYVEVEYNIVSTGTAKVAKIIMSGYDAATGNAYSSITCDSRERYTSDEGALINVAIQSPAISVGDDPSKRNKVPCLDDFLNILQTKFTDMVKNGRPIKVDFTLANDAARNFNSKIKTSNDKLLKDLIDDWLAENAYKNNYNLRGDSPVHLFYDNVRIPILDKNGRNFRMSKFGQYITEFLSSKGVNATRATRNGGLFITITN